MGRTSAAVCAFVGAFVALATPAAAFFEIDPLTRQPLYTPRTAAPTYGGPQDTYRPQATAVPRQVVSYSTRYAPGTIVVSTSERRLYYVLGNGQAIQYGVGVGRPGFEWAGSKAVTMKREWPDWRPPAQMLRRRPDLPRYMAGGPDNPLGARAMYLGGSLYRIHGSNEPETIGQAVSSGCIRMTNDDVVDLYDRVKVGTRVVVVR
jgi:lipoprotein-anchoring transpeptidase ErfK/SrfK